MLNFRFAYFYLSACFFFTALNLSGQNLVNNLNAKETEAALIGIVTDLKQVPEQHIEYNIQSEDNTYKSKGITDVEGKFTLIVPKGKKYKVTVEKMGMEYSFVSEVPNVKGPLEVVQNYVISFIMSFNRTYSLENVYFDTNKWDIKGESKETLDSLATTFLNNPIFIAEIAGHTDSQGDEKENLLLSQRRADAIRTYLIDKGVESQRVFSKGYGEKEPIASNETPEGRRKNRRTEVRIMFE